MLSQGMFSDSHIMRFIIGLLAGKHPVLLKREREMYEDLPKMYTYTTGASATTASANMLLSWT
jgi:hypothetical protein